MEIDYNLDPGGYGTWRKQLDILLSIGSPNGLGPNLMHNLSQYQTINHVKECTRFINVNDYFSCLLIGIDSRKRMIQQNWIHLNACFLKNEQINKNINYENEYPGHLCIIIGVTQMSAHILYRLMIDILKNNKTFSLNPVSQYHLGFCGDIQINFLMQKNKLHPWIPDQKYGSPGKKQYYTKRFYSDFVQHQGTSCLEHYSLDDFCDNIAVFYPDILFDDNGWWNSGL